ncbi:MAG: phosphotransferase [Acidimicrobiales bacterium]|nr:phosphotransferase [Acidimicrobiales bacterium]
MARRTKHHIPQKSDEFDAQWFTSTIGSKFGGVVTHVETETIGEGIGFLGELHRCTLTWQGGTEAPSSVIVKIPSKVAKNRSLGEGLAVYEREIRVYSEMGDCLGIPMPEFIYGECDANPAPWLETFFTFLFRKLPVPAVSRVLDVLLLIGAKSSRRYVLMMEDINDARPPSQVEGGSIQDTITGLDLLARFHAHNWNETKRRDAHPIIWSVGHVPKVVQASYRRNRDAFVERFGALIGEEMVAKMDEVQERLPELCAQLERDPWTLCHGDYRLDNLMFRSDGRTTVLDWQGLAWGRPGWEVAYFITTALEPEYRDEEQMMLVQYHETLVGAGVDNYTYEDLLEDVTISKAILAHRMVAGDDLLDTEMENTESDFIEVIVKRVVGWVDLDV